jgi:hypothetical protein
MSSLAVASTALCRAGRVIGLSAEEAAFGEADAGGFAHPTIRRTLAERAARVAAAKIGVRSNLRGIRISIYQDRRPGLAAERDGGDKLPPTASESPA